MEGWTFPEDVKGWLSEAEGRELASLAAGKCVLEIGSYHGRSTICMGQTAEAVLAIDHGEGDAETGHEPSTGMLYANLYRYGLADRVCVFPHKVEEAAAQLADAIVDLVFVDGAHDEASVVRDLELARRVLRPGGTIALHDADYATVQSAARKALGWQVGLNGETGGKLVGRLYHRPYTPGLPPDSGFQFVFLALPRRPEFKNPLPEAEDKVSLVNPVRRGFLKVSRSSMSLLNLAFNKHWANAMNAMRAGIALSHFAMQHDDIRPTPGWADVLIDEMERTGADVVSAVVPIKDPRGLTSTGVRNAASGHVRRLTMAEAMGLPETFGHEDLKRAGIATDTGPLGAEFLVINTGLWVCRLDRPWRAAFDGFRSVDGVRYAADGTCDAGCLPEDWCFSEWLWRHGCKAVATRKVSLSHIDNAGVEYRNDHAWGTAAVDPGDRV